MSRIGRLPIPVPSGVDVAIDDAILRALALQAPVAEDLRQVIAIKTMATDLERIGDRATNIAERTVYSATGNLPQMDVSAY